MIGSRVGSRGEVNFVQAPDANGIIFLWAQGFQVPNPPSHAASANNARVILKKNLPNFLIRTQWERAEGGLESRDVADTTVASNLPIFFSFLVTLRINGLRSVTEYY